MVNSKLNTKILAYQYAIFRLMQWEESVTRKRNTIGSVKSTHLIFYLTVSRIKEGGTYLLYHVFNNYYAMPYGVLESDIYNILANKFELDYLNVSSSDTKINVNKNIYDIYDLLDPKIVSEIDLGIEKLKSINPNIITYSTSDTIGMSKMSYAYGKASSNGKLRDSLVAKVDNSDLVKYWIMASTPNQFTSLYIGGKS